MKVLIRTMLAIIVSEVLFICSSLDMIPFTLTIFTFQALVYVGFIGWEIASYRSELLQLKINNIEKYGN